MNKNEVKFRGTTSVEVEYETNEKNGNPDNRRNRYNTTTRDGLNEEIQFTNWQNTI